MTTYLDWDDVPDPDHSGLYWVRWTSRYRPVSWHATFDGTTVLCKSKLTPPLVDGRRWDRCSHCVRAVAKLTSQ